MHRSNSMVALCALALALPLRLAAADAPARFTIAGRGAAMTIVSDGATLHAVRSAAAPRGATLPFMVALPELLHRLAHVTLRGAAGTLPRVTRVEEPLPGTVNFYVGDERQLWRRGVKSFASVVQAVGDALEVTQSSSSDGDRYRLTVRAGTDPGNVLLQFENDVTAFAATPLQATQDGVPLDASWKQEGTNAVSIAMATHDPARDVVFAFTIARGADPRRVAAASRVAPAVAIGPDGSVYVAGAISLEHHGGQGRLAPRDLQLPGGYAVQKFNRDGQLAWTTFLGGNASSLTYARLAIQPDDSGNVWIAATALPRFPVTEGAPCRSDCGIVAVRLGTEGQLLESRQTPALREVRSIAVDRHGIVALTGFDSGFVPVGGVTPDDPGEARYVACIAHGRVTWGTKLRGLDAHAVALLPDGTIVVGGAVAIDADSLLQSIPLLGYRKSPGGGWTDGYLLLLDPRATGMASVRGATYIGGAPGHPAFDQTIVSAIAIDVDGNIVAAGTTAGNGRDVFVIRTSADLAALQLSYGFGGSDNEAPDAIASDAARGIWLTGSTRSADFPLVRALPHAEQSESHAFIARVDPAGRALTISSFAGAGGKLAIAAAGGGAAWIAGGDWPFAAQVTTPNVEAVQTSAGAVLLRVDCPQCPREPEPAPAPQPRAGASPPVAARITPTLVTSVAGAAAALLVIAMVWSSSRKKQGKGRKS